VVTSFAFEGNAMATGATGVALRVGAPCCVAVSCASSSSSPNRVSGSGAPLPTLKVDGSGMKFRDRPGLLRWEDMKVWSPVVGAAPRRFDAFEEPSASGLSMLLSFD
jgi:hypothetical protein